MKIMITGAAGYFGHLITERFRREFGAGTDIIGIDVREYGTETEQIRFVTGDTRKKRIEDIFKVEGKIDVVIHLARESAQNIDSTQSMMTNVYGAWHILELCRKYAVGKFIFPSASIVYGAREENPALIREDHPLLGNRDVPTIRDRVEADMVCQVFTHADALPRIVLLRFVPIWRKGGTGMMSKYMKKDIVPTILGFDPMFQMVFDDEVLDAFVLAVKNPDARGAYNIRGRLFMPLSRIIRFLDKKPVPMPEFMIHDVKNQFLWSSKVSFDFNYIKFPFCVDGDRAKEELGFDPNARKT